jgi:predicted N-acetyltransferase YhbS
MKQYPPERLQPGSNMRQYVALDDREPVGWVASVRFKDAGWVSDLHVQETHRRRGIGRALMNRLLLDDRAAGLEASVLLATNAGAMLYPLVGYRQIGELLIYCPKR